MHRSLPTLFCTALISFAALSGCSKQPDNPVEEAAELEPLPIHQLPLGITLDEAKQRLIGSSSEVNTIVRDRMYRALPLNSYDQQGFGGIELDKDGKVRTYHWSTNLKVLSAKERRFYDTTVTITDALARCLRDLQKDLGEPIKEEPYPEEFWYVWTKDSARINLTQSKGTITLTKSLP